MIKKYSVQPDVPGVVGRSKEELRPPVHDRLADTLKPKKKEEPPPEKG